MYALDALPHSSPKSGRIASNTSGSATDPHDPISRLVCLENTHNRCGGTCQSVAYTGEVAAFAHERGLKVHLDGRGYSTQLPR